MACATAEYSEAELKQVTYGSALERLKQSRKGGLESLDDSGNPKEWTTLYCNILRLSCLNEGFTTIRNKRYRYTNINQEIEAIIGYFYLKTVFDIWIQIQLILCNKQYHQKYLTNNKWAPELLRCYT